MAKAIPLCTAGQLPVFLYIRIQLGRKQCPAVYSALLAALFWVLPQQVTETDEPLFLKVSSMQTHGGFGVESWFGISGFAGSSDGVGIGGDFRPLYILFMLQTTLPQQIKIRAPVRL